MKSTRRAMPRLAWLRFASVCSNCTIIGDEAYCRDKIAELQERIGLTNLICWQNFGDLSHDASMASQRRLIEKVAPSFS